MITIQSSRSVFSSFVGLVSIGFIAWQPQALAGTAQQEIVPLEQESPASRGIGLLSNTTFDYVAPASYRGSANAGRISTYSLTTSLQQRIGLSRDFAFLVGGIYRQFWFQGGGSGELIPSQAGSIAATGGIQWKFLERWSFRGTGSIGVYSDWRDLSSRDWNFDISGTFGYDFCDSLTVFVGAAYFPQFQIPVLPTAGVRWQITDQWKLNLLLPKPSLEYAVTDSVTVYGFGQLAGGRFRVGENFGSSVGRPNLDGRWLSYLDIRTGGGLAWSPLPWATWRIEAGSSVYREFEYEDAGFSFDAGPAFFASTSLGLRF